MDTILTHKKNQHNTGTGKIVSLQKGVIRGWIPKSANRQKLHVFINREALSNSINFYKEANNKVYFKVSIGQEIDLFSQKQIDLQLNGKSLKNSPIEYIDKLFFIHIPKTAGTTFRSALNTIVSDKYCFPRVKQIRLSKIYSNIDQFANGDVPFSKDVKLVYGHYPFAVSTLFPHIPRKIVFLRNPIERCISYIFHLKRVYPDKSIEQIFKIANSQMNNYQVRFLADNNTSILNCFKGKAVNIKALENAKKNLKSCDVIGISERFSESITLCEKTLGLTFKKINFLNEGTNKNHDLLTEEQFDYIVKNNTLDLLLYEYGLFLFNRRLSEITSSVKDDYS